MAQARAAGQQRREIGIARAEPIAVDVEGVKGGRVKWLCRRSRIARRWQ